MSQQFLTLGILLLPIQVFSLFLMGSRYDLSAFVLLALAAAFAFRYGVRARTVVVLLLFVLTHVFLYAWFGVAPYYRVFSGVVWLGGLLFFLLEGPRLRYSQEAVFRLILLVLSLSAVQILIEYFVFRQDRPGALFHEPSFAGLCLYSAGAGLLVSLIVVKSDARLRLLMMGCLALLFSAALLTFSMHIVTFLVSLGVLSFVFWIVRLPRIGSIRIRLGTGLFIALICALLVAVAGELSQMEHYARRMDFANPTNYSLLSWLRGLDQMRASISLSPLLGVGLGSTGFFDFSSRFSDILARMGRPELNLTDAYSLAFRLVIEIGLPLVVFFLMYLIARGVALVRYVDRSSEGPPVARVAVVFNFVFAATVIAGCLLKEPLYPQSFLYLAVVLISSVPLSARPADKLPGVAVQSSLSVGV